MTAPVEQIDPAVAALVDNEAVAQDRIADNLVASLLLLCQTIVMAQHSLDGKIVGQARSQRIESASTSLSEIDPIR